MDEATILSLVSCGLGVAFVNQAVRWRCPKAVVLLPVTDMNVALPLTLIWKRDNDSPLLANFVASVRQMPGVVQVSP
jgi:DNA-binding transcriptional LysR family regulator